MLQETTFYYQLQNSPSLDLRDNRGKVHKMSFILMGLVLALLQGRDGNLSSIHRFMSNKNDWICHILNIDKQKVVSRAQLPKILQKVHLSTFEKLLFSCFGIKLSETEKQWFAGDGKDLKGSILDGKSRGTAVVQLVSHDNRDVAGQLFYQGDKESEKPTLRTVIENTGLANQKISADALHLCPKTTSLINEAGGIFLVGLKGNQPTLLQDMIDYANFLKPVHQLTTIDKGHGRIEKRTYYHYNIEGEYFDKRWATSSFKSLVKTIREITYVKKNITTTCVSYYISNQEVTKDKATSESLFKAVRQHWSVEVSNYTRDVTLKEDKFKTQLNGLSKTMANIRTLAVKILSMSKPKNMTAQIERFADKTNELVTFLRKIKFL